MKIKVQKEMTLGELLRELLDNRGISTSKAGIPPHESVGPAPPADLDAVAKELCEAHAEHVRKNPPMPPFPDR